MISNPLLDAWLNACAFTILAGYFAPYFMPQLVGETEQWATSVSLNGARWSNVCNPAA